MSILAHHFSEILCQTRIKCVCDADHQHDQQIYQLLNCVANLVDIISDFCSLYHHVFIVLRYFFGLHPHNSQAHKLFELTFCFLIRKTTITLLSLPQNAFHKCDHPPQKGSESQRGE